MCSPHFLDSGTELVQGSYHLQRSGWGSKERGVSKRIVYVVCNDSCFQSPYPFWKDVDICPSKEDFLTLKVVQRAGQRQMVSAQSGLTHFSVRAKNEAVGIQHREHGQGPSRERERQS